MTDPTTSTTLAKELEDVTRDGLTWIKNVLAKPIDSENAALLRAQSSAAGNAVNAQLRADALRLRSEKSDNALERLIDLMRKKELLIPSSVKESCSSPQGSLDPTHS